MMKITIATEHPTSFNTDTDVDVSVVGRMVALLAAAITTKGDSYTVIARARAYEEYLSTGKVQE